MRLRHSVTIPAPFSVVSEHFGEGLFRHLSAAGGFPAVRVEGYDGEAGGLVRLRLLFPGFSQAWHSRIAWKKQEAQSLSFMDEGVVLPFFLRSWQHTHRVLPTVQGTRVEDDVTYSTPWWLPAPLLWLALKGMFAQREGLYRSYYASLMNQ